LVIVFIISSAQVPADLGGLFLNARGGVGLKSKTFLSHFLFMNSFELLFNLLLNLTFSGVLENLQALSHLHWLFIRVLVVVTVVRLLILGSCSIARDVSLLRRFFLSSFFRGLSFLFLETQIASPPVLPLCLLSSQVSLSKEEEI